MITKREMFDEAIERQQEKMPRPKIKPEEYDLDLIILKGHLLIEERLTSILETYFKDPNIFKNKVRPTFHKKVLLLKAFKGCENENFVMFCDAALILNDIRNCIAHHLEPRMLDRNINKFLDFYKSAMPEECTSELHVNIDVSCCISLIDGYFVALMAESRIEDQIQEKSRSV